MSITDELRELAHVFSNVWLDKDGSVTYTTGTSAPSLESVNFEKHIKDIADRIDAEHERAVRYERCAFWHDASDDELAHYGLLRAPIDADGVQWYLNDRDEYGGTVGAIKLDVSGFWINVGCIYRPADKARHYHAPTVEDVLHELVGKAQVLSCIDAEDELVADFAKRLRLAGEDE